MISGGAGFVGTNLAARLLEEGREVLIFDNLSRAGVECNLQWLVDRYGGRVPVEVHDVRDALAVRYAVARSSAVYPLAAQVAVTSSLVDPGFDFEVNARGTLNVLEACRGCAIPPPLLFTSTNKVYGSLPDLRCERSGGQYRPISAAIRDHGISEDRPLEFHSPYGCSKGCADQYVLDYARCYRLPAVVFRMSCIYGPHQCGTEDQGWLAHFARRVLADEPLAIYGDGRQVRDVLFVTDLVAAMRLAFTHIESMAGRALNIGGGPSNAVSVVQAIDRLGELQGRAKSLQSQPEKGSQLQASGKMMKVGDKQVLLATRAKFGGRDHNISRQGQEYTGTVTSTRRAKVRGQEHLMAELKTQQGKKVSRRPGTRLECRSSASLSMRNGIAELVLSRT